MLAITLYEGSTGRILGWVEGDTETLEANKSAGPFVEGKFDPETHWINTGQATLRLPLPVQLEDGSLLNVPPNSLIRINDTEYVCKDGGRVELEFDQPGTYTVRLECWPYLDAEFTIENQT